MPAGIGITELLILLVVVLLVFGPKRLPEMGRSLGRGLREFKDSVSGRDVDEERPPAESPAHSPSELPPGDPVHPPTRESRERDTVS